MFLANRMRVFDHKNKFVQMRCGIKICGVFNIGKYRCRVNKIDVSLKRQNHHARIEVMCFE